MTYEIDIAGIKPHDCRGIAFYAVLHAFSKIVHADTSQLICVSVFSIPIGAKCAVVGKGGTPFSVLSVLVLFGGHAEFFLVEHGKMSAVPEADFAAYDADPFAVHQTPSGFQKPEIRQVLHIGYTDFLFEQRAQIG